MLNNGPDQIRKRLYEEYEDSFFKLVMYDAAEKEGKQLLFENEQLKNDPEYSPTQKTIQSFRKILDSRTKKYKIRKKNSAILLKGSAVAVFSVIILFSTLMVTVQAFRVEVLNLLIDIQPEYTSFQLKGDGKSSGGVDKAINWTDSYVPSYIPEGFSVSDISSNESLKRIVYENEKKDSVIMYMELSSSNNLALDTENASLMKTVSINGHDGTLVVKEPMCSVVWEMDNKMFLVQTQESIDETMKIAEGVTYVK